MRDRIELAIGLIAWVIAPLAVAAVGILALTALFVMIGGRLP